MNATITNYVPAPKSIELHLTGSPEFSRYSKKVKAIGGSYSACRGWSSTRFVNLPWNQEGWALANKLIAEFGRGRNPHARGSSGTVVIARGVGHQFRGKNIHAPVVVHYIDKSESDPCGKFWELYEAAFLRAFPEAAEPEPVVEKKPPVLRFNLSLEGRVEFFAVLEALQQYIENGEDADHLSDDHELQAKVDAASGLRDQLEATLASLAE